MQLSFAPLVEEVGPAVVNIYAERQVRQRRSPFAGDPFFDQFFGNQFSGPPRVQSSLGSGVIVGERGLVVTNQHVIDGADAVRIVLSDGREFESEVLLRDSSLDLAVLRMEARRERFPTVGFGNSDALLTGDLVLAIGNPFGVGQTITSGIVSAVARNRVGVSDFGFFIQTDAAINSGNSGGALVNMQGELVGINTAIYTRSGGSNGIGFAIPANIVEAVVRQAEQGSDDFVRPYIGAAFSEVTPQIAEALGMRRPLGALVEEVFEASPAASAGLRPGDVVVEVNGQQIEHPDALGYRLATIGPGNEARFSLLSRGRERVVEIVLGSPRDQPEPRNLRIEGRGPFAGTEVTPYSRRLAQRLRLPRVESGFVVVGIERGSPAQRAGMRIGDIILNVNGSSLDDIREARRVLEADTRSWRFTLNRGGRTIRQFLRF
ncbi:MAG: Do family serine endopeptidase [Pseudomonadota bacterium]